MQMTIDVPNTLPIERLKQRIKELEQSLQSEAQFFTNVNLSTQQQNTDNDPWTNTELTLPTVDTGIEDFALNHDHYLYGVNKT